MNEFKGLTEEQNKQVNELIEKMRMENAKPKIPSYEELKSGYKIYENGQICDCSSNVEEYIQKLYKQCNWFPTRELAEEEVKYRAISQELKMWADTCEPCDWEDGYEEKYYLYYCYQIKQIGIDWCYQSKANGIYFSSKEVLEKALESIGPDRLIREYFRVKE